jgi:retinoid hydroxylase
MTTSTDKAISSLPLPPGNYGLPILGDTFQFLLDPNILEKKARRYGPVFKTKLLGFDAPYIVLLGKEGNQFILANENKYFISYLPTSTRKLFGKDTIALQTGDIHLNRRRILANAFQPRALEKYSIGMIDITKEYLRRWEKLKHFNWYPFLNNYTFDIACKLLINKDAASNTPFEENYKIWGQGIFSLPLKIPGSKYTKGIRSMNILLGMIEGIINERLVEGVSKKEDVLDILLASTDETGRKLEFNEVQEQILTILLAGHGTLTSSLASFCILLNHHPDIKQKCRDEIQELGLIDSINYDNLKKATYIGEVLQEVLRLNPPVGGAFRKVIQECEYGGYRLPKGWNISFSIKGTHKNDDIYPFSDKFRPERFLSGSERDLSKSYSYLPYGGGVRECLGKEFANLEMKIFAVSLLSHYDWELKQKGQIKMGAIPFLHPLGGLPVKFWRI